MVKAFVKTPVGDYVAGGDLPSATRVIEQIAGWIEDYNTFELHSSHGKKSPAEFRRDRRHLQTPGVSRQPADQGLCPNCDDLSVHLRVFPSTPGHMKTANPSRANLLGFHASYWLSTSLGATAL
jgi:hypothetical protein